MKQRQRIRPEKSIGGSKGSRKEAVWGREACDTKWLKSAHESRTTGHRTEDRGDMTGTVRRNDTSDTTKAQSTFLQKPAKSKPPRRRPVTVSGWLGSHLGQVRTPRVVRRSCCQTFIVPLACQILKRLFPDLSQSRLRWISPLSLRLSQFATILLYSSQRYQERWTMLGSRSTMWSETQNRDLILTMAPLMRMLWRSKTDGLIGRWRYGRGATNWPIAPKRSEWPDTLNDAIFVAWRKGQPLERKCFLLPPWGKVRVSQYNTLATDSDKLKYASRRNARTIRRCRFH